MVDTYGIPDYKEVNPAYFAMVSFPFLFGVMFGDIMHGTILLTFGIWIVFAEKTKGSLAEMLAPMRYFFTLMGFFSLFCGLIYNDFNSMPLQLFKSCYVD